MLKSYLKIALVAFVSFMVAACVEPDEKDSVVINGATEVVFTLDDNVDKTVTFSSTADWTLSYDADWFTVTPANGDAGENVTVIVSLVELESEVERTAKVVISAGNAFAEFSVKQSAGVYADSITIEGESSLNEGAQTRLNVVPTPANGVIPGTVTFTSSDETIAKVTADTGIVTAVAAGEVVITATAGDLTAEFKIEVIGTSDENTYTFADLAAMENSGVVYEDGAYVITADFDLYEGEVLTLGDAKRVVFNDGVCLSIDGLVDFVASEEVVFEAAEGATPEPIYFTGNVESGGTFKNITFKAVSIRYFGVAELNIENCSFTGITDSESCINLGGSGLVTVSNCEFIENAYPAISGAANLQTPVIFQDNYLYKNSATARNKPQINLTAAGDGVCKVLRNKVIGPNEVTTNGGICVSNMMSLAGTNDVEISGNEVSDNRYGIALYGQMNAVIKDNVLKNNDCESEPMNGGSGVSLYGIGVQNVYMSGNHIEGHYWGITNIKYYTDPNLNLGNLTEGDDYNPGGNVFVNNGNGGVLYDLYNNSTADVMAQGNTWNVAVQDEKSIEEVIVHKVDNSSLGLVTFMPAASDK